MHTPADVPSPIDFRQPHAAAAWAEAANRVRPWRADFFAAFIDQLRQLPTPTPRIIDLGSGPGFLAHAILSAIPGAHYTLVDFSDAMHALARTRLAGMPARFLTANLAAETWNEGLGPVDAVVTLQTVHELRHKRHAMRLHAAVRRTLRKEGTYLVCDHFIGPDAMSNTELYMTADEQQAALHDAGFDDVSMVLMTGGMLLLRARTGA